MEEFAADYFDIATTNPYMLVVAEINENLKKPLSVKEKNIKGLDMLSIMRSTIPTVTHVNYSARLQTVNKESHPDFYRLINAFYEITGCPLVINTSFNRMDEPIVNTPLQAIDCFNKTGMDVLVMGHFVIEKAK